MKRLDTYGEPAVTIAGLRLWIHGREHPEAEEFWDANWVTATASCSDENANVITEGPILHLSELEEWLKQLGTLYESLSGEAKLECMEPNLGVVIVADKLGHMAMAVHITPDHTRQEHAFSFTFDQTHLSGLIESCRKVLEEYPIRFALGQEKA